MRVVSIVGARPQFIKLAPVSAALRQYCQEVIIHTGQHYDYHMSAIFFEELALPVPDYHLEVGSGSHGVQTARMLQGIEQVLMQERADWVIVYGDTNSTLAGALAAAKLHIPIAHVEAGLRSFNRTMPEEINRVLVDHLAARLFCPTETAKKHAYAEGISSGVEVVGDVMYDILCQVQPKLAARAETLFSRLGITPQNYVLATVHRPANTDDPVAMREIAWAFNRLEMPVVFPVHPRTRARLASYDIAWRSHVHFIDPVGYADILALQRSAQHVITDSGGIQKEAFLLGVPCVTLRDDTEWPETIDAGWNILAGAREEAILAAIRRPYPQAQRQNVFGEGNAAQYIARHLINPISTDVRSYF